MSEVLTLPLTESIIKDVNNLNRLKGRLAMRNYHILAFQHVENVLKVLIKESIGTISRTHYLGTLFVTVERLYPGAYNYVRSNVRNASQLDKLLATNFLDLRYGADITAVAKPNRDIYIEVLDALLEVCLNIRRT
jgi:hypothetical protein